jgi:tetratricopeptide (TPR) repeat protein
MLKLSAVAPHEWEFAFPDVYKDLMNKFYAGCEFYEEGNLNEAERAFRSVLAQMPDHLDALHHLAIVLSKRDLGDQAFNLWEQAVRIGHKAFPQGFKAGLVLSCQIARN